MQIIDCLAITAVQCFFVLLTEMPSKPRSNSIDNTFIGIFFPSLGLYELFSLSPLMHAFKEGRASGLLGCRCLEPTVLITPTAPDS